MSVNKTVFASKSERENYYKLKRIWGEKYIIYHNLPFLNVFNPKDLVDITTDWSHPTPFTLTEIEFNRLKKTSIDFTLCDQQDNPTLCIEFDGMQQGFNVGTKYYPEELHQPPNPWRRQITELKLKVALGSVFPFFVVGSKQFDDLSREIRLTIVDGIIGTVMASKGTMETIGKGFNPEDVGWTQEDFEKLTDHEQHEIVHDWVICVEVDQEFEQKTTTRARARLETELGVRAYGFEYLTYPPLDYNSSLEERTIALESAIYHGTRITLRTLDSEEVQAEAWIPNFNVAGFSPYGLSEDIAFLLALEKLKKLQSKKADKS